MAVKAWALALIKDVSSEIEPVYYYNSVRKTWVKEFQGGCAFFSEKDCLKAQEELNIFGVEIVKGSID